MVALLCLGLSVRSIRMMLVLFDASLEYSEKQACSDGL
jgi:hypothetical protein